MKWQLTKRELDEERKMRPQYPIRRGDECVIIYKPCCFKLEASLSANYRGKAKFKITLGKTIFDRTNKIRKIIPPNIKTTDGTPLQACLHCGAPIIIKKDVSKMVTCWEGDLVLPKEEDE